MAGFPTKILTSCRGIESWGAIVGASVIPAEQSGSGRTSVYDGRVTNQVGERVALFRGQTRRIKVDLVADLTAAD